MLACKCPVCACDRFKVWYNPHDKRDCLECCGCGWQAWEAVSERGSSDELGAEAVVSSGDERANVVSSEEGGVDLVWLGPSARLQNALERVGVTTVEQLEKLSAAELLRMDGIGRTLLAEARHLLSIRGSNLRDDEKFGFPRPAPEL